MKTRYTLNVFLFYLISLISYRGYGQSPPVADFAWGTPQLPNKVQFQDESTNQPTSWQWNFGDGGGSQAQNPVKTYAANGTYHVCLTASNAIGSSPSTCKDIVISLSGSTLSVALPSTTLCVGSIVNMDAEVNGGMPPLTYNWSSTGDTLSCSSCVHPHVVATQNSIYSVTIIDAYNVSGTASANYTLNGATNTMQVSALSTSIDCLHPLDTTLITINNGTPTFEINWGDNSQDGLTEHHYFLGSTYVISVTDTLGCVSSIVDTVPFNGIMLNVLQKVQPICPDLSTGKITVAATGGTNPYSFLWSSGATGDSLTNITSGVYRVTVSDVTSCSAVYYYNLGPIDGWAYYAYLNPTAFNCHNNGAITTTVSGGIPPYNFVWNNGDINQNIMALAAGNYSVTVSDSLGCNTTGHATVNNECYSVLTGTVYNDTNYNCIFDSGEAYPWQINLAAYGNGHTYYGNTLPDGSYSILVPSIGVYGITIANFNTSCNNISACNSNYITATTSILGDTSYNNNFGINASPYFDLSIQGIGTHSVPGFLKNCSIYCYNLASAPFTGQTTITYNYSPNLIYQSGSLNPVHNIIAHTLSWTLNTSLTAHSNPLTLNCSFLVPANLSLGTPLPAYFHITPSVGDCDTSNNSLHFTEIVVGSFDPNEKEVFPAGKIYEEDSVLTYTIHFQNTGNDSTHFITIKDTLSPSLDPTTVLNVASSHPYSEFVLSGTGILKWVFNPLRLVDSFTNEPGSHGFVKFTVKKKANIPIGSTISNTAHIYFDYNEPVVTNTVADTMSEPNSIFEIRSTDGISVKAYPNPFTNATNIVVEGLKEKFDFELFDVTGRLGRKISSIETNQFQLTRDNLPTGVYFFKILSLDKRRSGFGKLVVE